MYARLTRIEGEGEVVFITSNGLIQDVEYRVVEAPRFFEYIARGRHLTLIPDIMSRICGLCGTSYILVATKAFENCLGMVVPEEVEKYREAVHLAERVKSHVVHVFFLELPGLANLSSIVEYGRFAPHITRSVGIMIELVGKIMDLLGGRTHNIVSIRIGGAWKQPSLEDVGRLRNIVEKALAAFKSLLDFVLSLRSIPEEVHELTLCTLGDHNTYPHLGVEVRCGDERYRADEFYEKTVDIMQRRGSNSLMYRLRGRSFVVGPIARYNMYFHALAGEVKDAIEAYGWSSKLKNVHQSIIARVAEIYDALIKLKEFTENYRPLKLEPYSIECNEVKMCFYAIEAPRGILYHRYTVDDRGTVIEANIVTPTAQNILAMEDIARGKLKGRKADEKAVDIARKIAISFDPCLSCSVHTLRVKVVEQG